MFLFGSGRAGTIDNAKPFVDRFSGQFTVACPDQRGLGHSDIPDGPWTMADYAADAFGIADHLGWEKFSIIGLSFGGMVGLEMAATQPQRIDRMVLWGTSPGGAAHSYPLHTLSNLPPDQQHRKFAELMDTRLSAQWKSKPSPEMMLVQAVLERGGSPWKAAKGEDKSRNRGFELQLEARRHHDVTDRLGDIQCATHIGAGWYDGLAPVANAEAMHAGIRNSELRIYQAGHFFYLDKKAFNDGFSFLTGR
jgi:3-oxoadipate enol-lactonase